MTDLRTAAQQVEPVAFYLPQDGEDDSLFRDARTVIACTGNKWLGWKPLYTTPPRREWVGLTDEQIDARWRTACADETLRTTADLVRAFARALEQALKERNQ